MSQFHFAEEDAESPQSAPAGAPPAQTGTPQTGVSQPPNPSSPLTPDLPLPVIAAPAPTAVKPNAAPTPANTPIAPAMPVPIAPPVPIPSPPVPPVAATPAVATPPAPKAPAPNPDGAAPHAAGVPQAKPLQPKPLQPRVPQGGGAPGTPQARPAVPAIQIPDPTATLATASAMPDAEGVAQGPVPTDHSSNQLYVISKSVEKVLDTLETPASWVLRVTFPIAVLCLAFLLATVFTGNVARASAAPNLAEFIRNLTIAGTGFRWAFILAALASLVAGYQDNRLGAIVAGIGVLFHFGAPLGLKAMAGDNAASAAISYQILSTGRVLIVIGAIKGIFDLFAFLWKLPDTIKTKYASVGANRPIEALQRQRAKEANMLSPCWNLPFCREAIRKMCPAFLARTTCWKFKRGCYCDEEMIARIVRGDSIDAIKAPTKISQSRQPPCGRCYIYLEHQTYKFRMLSPLALPTSVAISYMLWPAYTKVFTTFEKTTNSLWNSLTFTKIDPLNTSKEAQVQAASVQIDPAQMAMYTQWIFGLLAGFFILIYLSKFIEWAIFKAKW